MLVLGQEQIPQARLPSFWLEVFYYSRRRPPVTFNLILEAPLVRIDVLHHEGLQTALQVCNLLAECEIHVCCLHFRRKLDAGSISRSTGCAFQGAELNSRHRSALFQTLAGVDVTRVII